MPNQEPTKICGNVSPGLIATNSNTVMLDYHIDNKGQSAGWSLDYSTKSESKEREISQLLLDVAGETFLVTRLHVCPAFDWFASQE